jgi:hypothetical protein
MLENYPIAGYYSFSIRDDREKLEELRKEARAIILNNSL